MHHLRDGDIDGPRNGLDASSDLLGEPVGGFQVAPLDLDIDGGGKSKIQNLADNIGGFVPEADRRIFFMENVPYFSGTRRPSGEGT